MGDYIFVGHEGFRRPEPVYKIVTDTKLLRSTVTILVGEAGSATLSIFGAAANNKYFSDCDQVLSGHPAFYSTVKLYPENLPESI